MTTAGVPRPKSTLVVIALQTIACDTAKSLLQCADRCVSPLFLRQGPLRCAICEPVPLYLAWRKGAQPMRPQNTAGERAGQSW